MSTKSSEDLEKNSHHEKAPHVPAEVAEITELSTRLENPLAGKDRETLEQDAIAFCNAHGLQEYVEDFRRGAYLAGFPHEIERVEGITDEELLAVRNEKDHKWNQPWQIYYVAIISSMAAVVQGMDESVVNGAQVFYYDRFGLTDTSNNKTVLIQGLLNSGPYLCCAVFSCWLTDPLNRYLGRRGTIFWSCVIAALASIWEAFTYSWPQLFVARLVLGLGIGPKSATAPIYTAECSPAPIRGALVMQWQMWTAFGIALGDVVSVIFANIEPNVAWRLMLGSTVLAPIIVCVMIYFAPESPRWYINKGRYEDAFKSMVRLRRTRLQAARDLFYMNALLEIEADIQGNRNLLLDLFRIPRNRRAAQASGLVMFMQQFCGVNVIAYYSTTLFIEAGFTRTKAILVTMGTGLVNWLFAIPAMYTIDTYGRRNLLLVTFPCMAACLLLTGFGFWVEEGTKRTGVVALGIFLFMVFYSPGEGPVPFTYSAEAFPLYIRDLGMSYATSVCWLFNFVLSISFPALLKAFKPQGAFGYYAAWCMIGWVVVLFTLPETKALTLEELDLVFSVPTSRHAKYQWKNSIWHIRKYVLFQDLKPLPPLYQIADLVSS
jgi:sugar porter (SP) family MFS transporter